MKDINILYQNDNKFENEESIYYIIAGHNESCRKDQSQNYYIMTNTAVFIYDVTKKQMIDDVNILIWPLSNEDYVKQNELGVYFEKFIDGEIYKVKGRLQYNSFGELAFLYVLDVLEESMKGTVLDKKKKEYLSPVVYKDKILGKLFLKKSDDFFKGSYHNIHIYVEVNWKKKETWKLPLNVARDFFKNYKFNEEKLREYIVSDQGLYEEALKCVKEYEDECDFTFTTPQQFKDELKGYMKYIFVNEDGSYTVGYDDGNIFAGHQIDVDVDENGQLLSVKTR